MSFSQSTTYSTSACFVFVSFADNYNLILSLVFMCIVFSGGIGLSTAVIMKKLDNIVKLYTQALSNMFTSIACTLLFPKVFSINVVFLICLVMILFAISMYENKNLDTMKKNACSLTTKLRQFPKYVLLISCSVAVAVVLYDVNVTSDSELLKLRQSRLFGNLLI